jgi:hypothetical protein
VCKLLGWGRAVEDGEGGFRVEEGGESLEDLEEGDIVVMVQEYAGDELKSKVPMEPAEAYGYLTQLVQGAAVVN